MKLDHPPLNLIGLAGLLLEPCRSVCYQGICHVSGMKDCLRFEFCHLFVGPLPKAGLVLSDRFRFDIIFVNPGAEGCRLSPGSSKLSFIVSSWYLQF